jgi:hypothetical protein
MPRSIKRRIELLERRPTPGPAKGHPGWLLGQLELLVEANHPITAPAAFKTCWAAYLSAREQLASSPGQPPHDYHPEWPEPERQRVWIVWDDPRLNAFIDPILEMLVEAGKVHARTRPSPSPRV